MVRAVLIVRMVAVPLSTTWLALVPPLAAADGVAIVDIYGNTGDRSEVMAAASDDRFYVCGTSRELDSIFYTPRRFILAFNSTGELVATFGDSGDVGVAPCTAAAAYADGRLVTADYDLQRSTDRLSTYSTDGALLKRTDLPGEISARSIAVQTDGRLVVGGGRRPESRDWALARLNPDGSPDASFSGGLAVIDAGGDREAIADLVVLPNGKILAAGYRMSPEPRAVVVGRLNADGSRDFAFGANGQVALPTCAPNSDCGSGVALAIDGSGGIFVTGAATAVTRINSNGSVDTAYVSAPTAHDTPITDVAIDSLGRAAAFGTRFVSNDDRRSYVARFNTDGSRDTTFAVAGEAVLSIGYTGQSYLASGLLQPDDKPVVLLTAAGESGSPPDFTFGPTDVAIARLAIDGTLDSAFAAVHLDSDVYPDSFEFETRSAPYGTTSVLSNVVTVSGINSRTSVHISSSTIGSGYSVGCTDEFTESRGTILPGQSLCVRQSTSTTPGESLQAVVSVGQRFVPYTTIATSEPADTMPDAFSFVEQSGVARESVVTSNTIRIHGIAGTAAVSISNGTYSIGCDPARFTSNNGLINDVESICVRHTASSLPGTSVTTTIAIGGVIGIFTSTTAVDATPDPFTFTNQSGVTRGTIVVSNAVTVSGIDAPVPVSVINGEYSTGCASAWTSQLGTIGPGQQVCVRHTSATTPSTAVSTTLTVGGIQGTFTSTTVAADGDSGSDGGGGCFVATAAFGTPMMPEVRSLRAFRDLYLMPHPWGRAFVRFYYSNSPPVADYIRERPWARAVARAILTPFVLVAGWLAT